MSSRQPAVILINGASSAGKSTLARAFQAQVDVPFLRFSLDLLMFGGEVLPARREDAAFTWAAMRPQVFDGYYGCLAALAAAGNNIVVDIVIETREQRDRLVHRLGRFDVCYVALHCALAELERRERARGDRRIGDARRDFGMVAQQGPYDLELDGSHSAEANAVALSEGWKAWRRPGVFAGFGGGQAATMSEAR